MARPVQLSMAVDSGICEDGRVGIPFLGVALQGDRIRHLNNKFGRFLGLKKALIEIVMGFQAPYASTGLPHELLDTLHDF